MKPKQSTRVGMHLGGRSLKTAVEQYENFLVDLALEESNQIKARACEILQMNRTTLVEKLRKRGMIVKKEIAE